jgi:hypothetical protein
LGRGKTGDKPNLILDFSIFILIQLKHIDLYKHYPVIQCIFGISIIEQRQPNSISFVLFGGGICIIDNKFK